MKNLFLLFIMVIAAAGCTPPGEEHNREFKDLLPVDHQEELDHVSITEDRIGNWNPWKLLPEEEQPSNNSPATWASNCRGTEGYHPCDITATDHLGNPFSLYSLGGSAIVLDFSAGWCGPCRAAAEHAQTVQDQYRDQGLLYITVLIENSTGGVPTLQDVIDWATTYGNTDSLVIGGSRAMLESAGGTWALSGWPTFYYIDREMVIRDIDRGYYEPEVIFSIEWLLSL
jgi:thiol-disulfide isomerase/thioredoxin